ncbi:PQQ-dependent sugar dehydrogenase [Rhodoferax sp.]|uniref:PQQ-dependent sugar dehydrogenase n=1 Tax=Rhodoferax sp. TaxID=50421 RepID=UPI0026295E09|nr:PQQ-dependent sugar dehydrogenase [Rhodoferax sp.]MDD2920133.1 PQQ-dependent sugar dehydrogenase [Rhodoferax sp.]
MTRWIKTTLLASLASLALAAHAQTVRPEVVAQGLEHPWALAFLPQGRFLVTERPGRLRVIEADGRINAAVSGLPDVAARGQGGLLDVMLDGDFARNRTLFLCFSEPGADGNSTALVRAKLSDDRTRLESVRVIFSAKPKVASSAHFGCRIAESQAGDQPDGLLFMTLGERFVRKDDAQTLNNHHGKIIRIGKDGRVPADNPFVNTAGALPEIWSYGHRNPQGLALSPKGVLWAHEHGPQGGDEINLIEPGRNYGWPVITYGENYGGGPIGDGLGAKAGMAQPLHYWVPSIAPSGMAFVASARYGQAWVGDLLVGSLKFGYLDRIELNKPFEGKVMREHKLLADLGERIRDVRQGPDGLLYVLTDNARGRLLRLQPK